MSPGPFLYVKLCFVNLKFLFIILFFNIKINALGFECMQFVPYCLLQILVIELFGNNLEAFM
jgi:hypothetical protein